MSMFSSRVPWSISLSRDVTNRPKKITIEGNNYALFSEAVRGFTL